jgi:hypothetical protein
MDVLKRSLLVVGFFLAPMVQATVLDFEGSITIPATPPYVFSTNGYTIAVIDTPSTGQPLVVGSNLAQHGSNSFSLCGHCETTSSFDLYRDDGAPFDATSMEVGAWSMDDAGQYAFTITGYYAGGGSVTEMLIVTVAQGVGVVTFPATWKQLEHINVVTDNTGHVGFTGSTYDNINVNASVFSISYQNIPVAEIGGGTNTDPKPVLYEGIIADGVEYNVSVHWNTPYDIVYATNGPIFESQTLFFPSAESYAAANVLMAALNADGYVSLPSSPVLLNSALVMVPGVAAFGNHWGPAVRLDQDPLDVTVDTAYATDTAYDYIGYVRFDPAPLGVTIDIAPDDLTNAVFPNQGGKLPVAILSSPSFDATQVDPASLLLGDASYDPTPPPEISNVDGLHGNDQTVQFFVAEIGIECNQTELRLSGTTYAGDPIAGSGPIDASDCVAGGCHAY